MTPLISLKNVSFAYNKSKPNEVTAVSNASLNIYPGDFVGITGVSGSGKSTLLYILGGLLKPDNGTYIYKGNDITRYAPSKIAKLRNKDFGFILQDYGLLGDRTALENVCLPLMFSKCKWNQIEPRGIACMKALGIDTLKDKKVNNLSGGQCQRVAIARALINHPNVIFADEPTGALDSGNTEKLMHLLQTINSTGTTIVLVTHDNSIIQFCNKLYQINDGIIYPTKGGENNEKI